MNKRLLEYEFWNEERKFYQKSFALVQKADLNRIRKYIAGKILESDENTLEWLDIGTGDGSTPFDIVNCVNQLKTGIKFHITAIEPSKFSTPYLRKQFKNASNIKLQIKNKRVSLDDFIKGKYHAITFLHSNYYLGLARQDYNKIYTRAFDALRPNGVLLVQSIANNSDFQKLGDPKHSVWSLGDSTRKIFGDSFLKTEYKKLPTHFDATGSLSGNPSEARHFYRFVTQTQKDYLSRLELSRFQKRIKKLAKKRNGKYILNFWDCINVARA